MKDVEKIKPTGLFTNYIFKAIPLAFDESLSYYECLCGLLSFLKETVIPTVNNNADAIIEVQNLMTQLQNYVDNYFDNLDVQEEINNKLDKMVSDGTFDTIINQTLFNDLNNKVNNNTNEITKINDYIENDELLKNKPTLFIGDSYLANTNNNFGLIYKNLTGLDDDKYYNFSSPGAGFVATGSGGKTFLQVLQENINNITNKNEIKQIIVGCGVNDAQYNVQYNLIGNALEIFMNYCYSNFPKAKVFLLGCGYNVGKPSSPNIVRYNMAVGVIDVYQQTRYTHQPIFIYNSNLWLHDKDYISSDLLHPSESGQYHIAKKLIRALHGDYKVRIRKTLTYNLLDNTNSSAQSFVDNNILNIISPMISYIPTEPVTLSFNNDLKIGTFDCDNIFPMNETSCKIPVTVNYIIENNYYTTSGILTLKQNGDITIRIFINTPQSNIRRINISDFNYCLDATFN